MYDDYRKKKKERLNVLIHHSVLERLQEIELIENLPREKLITKMITNYVPVPVPRIPGEFKCITTHQAKKIKNRCPYTITVSPYRNKKIGLNDDIWKQWKNGEISWEEVQRKYLERLLLPDAQAEIQRLKKLQETQDVYITSWEVEEEQSLRKLFVDIMNGKIIWK